MLLLKEVVVDKPNIVCCMKLINESRCCFKERTAVCEETMENFEWQEILKNDGFPNSEQVRRVETLISTHLQDTIITNY